MRMFISPMAKIVGILHIHIEYLCFPYRMIQETMSLIVHDHSQDDPWFITVWWYMHFQYRQVSNIRRAWVGNEIVDHSDVAGASPVDAAPTTSSFSIEHLASTYCAKTTGSRVGKTFKFGYLVRLI